MTVVVDGTSINETRLGAVKDIQFAIDRLGLDDERLAIAGDNVLDFSLTKFIAYAKEKQTSCIMRYYESDAARLRKFGVAQADENDRIISLEEKPAEPKANWCALPFCFYAKEDACLVKVGIEAGCGIDAPGSCIAWLSAQIPAHSMEMPGSRCAIGGWRTIRRYGRSTTALRNKEGKLCLRPM